MLQKTNLDFQNPDSPYRLVFDGMVRDADRVLSLDLPGYPPRFLLRTLASQGLFMSYETLIDLLNSLCEEGHAVVIVRDDWIFFCPVISVTEE